MNENPLGLNEALDLLRQVVSALGKVNVTIDFIQGEYDDEELDQIRSLIISSLVNIQKSEGMLYRRYVGGDIIRSTNKVESNDAPS